MSINYPGFDQQLKPMATIMSALSSANMPKSRDDEVSWTGTDDRSHGWSKIMINYIIMTTICGGIYICKSAGC